MNERSILTPNQVRDMFLFVARRICDSEKYLTEIDMKIGDGDHGFGMALGFQSVTKTLYGKDYSSIEGVFQDIGVALLDTMGGASGILFGTMFISGSVGKGTHSAADLSLLAQIFRRSLESLKHRGKAQIGDKTMVDALEPAVIELEKSVKHALPLSEGLKTAAEGSKRGMEFTRQCVAKFGRAKSYGKKSIGLQDPGATSIWIIFQAMSDWINKSKDSNNFSSKD